MPVVLDHVVTRRQVAARAHRVALRAQAQRVRQLAQLFFSQVDESADNELAFQRRQKLAWAARLHEIGIDIAQASFHKHSAYIIANADMPGFSKREQAALAALVIAQRGRLAKVAHNLPADDTFAAKVLCLRLAVLLSRSRRNVDARLFSLARVNGEYRLSVKADWLQSHSLTEYELRQEIDEWKSAGLKNTTSPLASGSCT